MYNWIMDSVVESARKAYINGVNAATVAIYKGIHDVELEMLVEVGEQPNIRKARESTILHMRDIGIKEGVLVLS
jgi:hypothetical protein